MGFAGERQPSGSTQDSTPPLIEGPALRPFSHWQQPRAYVGMPGGLPNDHLSQSAVQCDDEQQ